MSTIGAFQQETQAAL